MEKNEYQKIRECVRGYHGFIYCVNREELFNNFRTVNGLSSYHFPLLMMLSFTSELSLKCILSYLNIEINKKHNLFELFSDLPADEQRSLFMYMKEKIKESDLATEENIIKELKKISNVFIQFRYPYELSDIEIAYQLVEAFESYLFDRVNKLK